MSIGLALLIAIIFGTWIWHPLYFNLEDVIKAAKQKAGDAQRAAIGWFNAKFKKNAKDPKQTPEDAAKQKEEFEVSKSTSVAMKAKEDDVPGAGGDEASMNLTNGQQQNDSSMLLSKMKGMFPVVYPICCMCTNCPSIAAPTYLGHVAVQSITLHTSMHQRRGD